MPDLSYTYTFDFSQGLGAWSSWMHPSVVDAGASGTDPGYVRLQAPGTLDPNHIDGIGALSLIAHLPAEALGAPGAFDLRDAEITLVIRGHDFNAHGARLVFWICSTLPDGQASAGYPVGVQITNWANTGNDLAGDISDDWQTITVRLDTDAADWTAAGNYRSTQGDWAERYQPLDLATALANVDATLHLVAISDSPADRPTGFLDLASITIHTAAPATNGRAAPSVSVHGDEDGIASGSVGGSGDLLDLATYALIEGSAHGGTVTLGPLTGAFVFVPDADFYGAASFQYVRTVGGVASDPLTALVEITPRNDAPLAAAAADDWVIAPDASFAFTLLRGSDVDGDRLTFQLVDGSVAHGTLALDAATGRYTFTPEAGYTGAAGFAYVVSDGQAISAPKAVTLQVADHAPVLPTFSDVIDTYLGTDMAAFVRYTILLAEQGDRNAAFHYGEWLASGNWVVQDTADAARYLRMGLGATDDAALELAQLYIAGDGVARDYGEARALLASIPNSAPGVFRLAMLDDLGLGAPQDHAAAVAGFLTAARMGHGEAMATLGRRYLAGEGVAASADDAYFWLKAALVAGSASFTSGFVEVLRSDLAQAAAALTADRVAALDLAAQGWTPGHPTPVNDAPLASAEGESAGTRMGHAIAGQLLGGTDADGDRLGWALVDASTAHGSVKLDARTGAYTYTPDTGFHGNASFTYALSDGQASSAAKRVDLSVALVAAAFDDDAIVAESRQVARTAATGVLANDVSGDASALAVTAVDGAAAGVGKAIATTYGTLTLAADGSYTYLADRAAALTEGQVATDTIAYEIADAHGEHATATLAIRVQGTGGTVVTGNGVLIGTQWADKLQGGSGADYLIGGDGNDTLSGGVGAPDTLQGGRGDDTYMIYTAGDSAFEFAGEGLDTVKVALAYYELPANVENLTATTRVGQTLIGNELANVITGGIGNDVIDGGAGADTLTGGAGADRFVFTVFEPGTIDRVTDFHPGEDHVVLSAALLGGLVGQALDPGAFARGAAADADDRILYDPLTGTLSYDADGAGGQAAIALAQLQPGLAITAADFVLS